MPILNLNPEINEYDEERLVELPILAFIFRMATLLDNKETAINRQNKFLDEEVNLFQDAYERAYSSQSEEDE